MNCFNHPERPSTAFCQSCGKPLCPECIRSADGLLLCEPDFLTRQPLQPATPSHGTPAAAAGYRPVGWSPQPGQYSGIPGQYPAGAPAPPAPPVHASPVLAGLLGFIPGVGAMYNGQFIKALLHVVVFIVLIGATEHFDLAGLLLTAWIFYQVFDAAQTASARRDGRPLPDPFGMLDLSQRLGPQSHAAVPYTPAAYPYASQPNAPENAQKRTASGFESVSSGAQSTVPVGGTSRSETYVSGFPPVSTSPEPGSTGAWTPGPPPQPLSPVDVRRGEPAGAIVLIVVGLLFLLSTLGFLDISWISRGWPVLVLLLGVWLLIRRLNVPVPAASYPTPPPVNGAAGNVGSGNAGTGFSQVNPLSIASSTQSQSTQPHTQDTDQEEK